MSYVATIVDNATGERREAPMDLEWHDEGSEFWWTEGNFGCDCNRFLEYERAGGREPDEDEVKCIFPGFESRHRFSVPFITFPDGSRVKIDGEAAR